MPEGKSEVLERALFDLISKLEPAVEAKSKSWALADQMLRPIIEKALLAEREAEHARCNATVKAAWGSNISLEAFEAALMQLPDSFRPHLPAPPSTEENLQHD